MTHPYASAAYARAFEGLAEPLHLPLLESWALARPISGSTRRDLCGCYPLCVLAPDGDLKATFDALESAGLVSFVLVADQFFGPSHNALQRAFDLVRPFKTHYVNDSSRPFAFSRHHRYEVKRARTRCDVEEVHLAQYLREWQAMYARLVERRGIRGLQEFSLYYFEQLASLPGLHAHAAYREQRIVAMHLWIEHENIVYSHLAASSEEGDRVCAGYALNDFALECFRGRIVDFGAGAGVRDDPKDGLARFKRGFANDSRIVQLCGKILDQSTYSLLCSGHSQTGYFPAYREARSRSV